MPGSWQILSNPARQRLAAVGASGLAVFAIYEITQEVRLWRVLPYGDQWEAVESYRQWITNKQSLLHLLFAQHNEHRMVPTRLAFLADFAFFDGRSIFVFPVLLFAHVTLGAALGLLASRGRQAGERALAVVFGIAIMVSRLQLDNLVLPFHLNWAACGLFSLIAIACTAHLAGPTTRRVPLVALAAISTFAAVYSSANGIAAAAMVLATSCLLPIGRISRIIIAAAAIFAIATFFTGYVFPDHHNRFATSFGSLGEIDQFLFFIPTFLGAFAHHFGSETSFLIGLLGICVWLFLAIVFVIRLRTAKVVDAAGATLLMLAAAALATAVMVAFGRTGIGLQEAMASKYATWGLLFWLALVAAADRMWAARSRPNPAIVCAGAVILVLSSLSGKGPLSSGRERARLLEDMTIRLQSGGAPENLKSIYPNPANVMSWLAFLRQHRMSIFADEARDARAAASAIKARGIRTQGSRTSLIKLK
jgi:hypothetical protein